ncbi:hypothetical protein HCU01_04260 [Halomonas cupida]|uniref:SatD family (SatD) n=1 Tax=Halomonas cupida TaxID=44933 RepID=A0A1M7A9K8_9GAMM|nr:hypothetical protein [Halomonas cupida]GEN22477.1 hypothetical protein HCU01_04260 [Halomonas cupida]SHL39402.1 hypothetical protein SAMN05660971_00418 [Halomonas cupida]
MPTTRIAVLTGDLVASQQSTTQLLYKQLDNDLEALAQRHNGAWSRFRGDGFQLALHQIDAGLDAAVALRAGLIAASPADQRWDARISLAIGDARWAHDQSLDDANDAPFIDSGRALDQLSDTDRRLVLAGVGPAEELVVRYLDEMLDGWSTNSAQSVALCLGEPGITQARLATLLGIRQPSVHKRLQVARWDLLNASLAYFRHYLLHHDLLHHDLPPITTTETQG